MPSFLERAALLLSFSSTALGGVISKRAISAPANFDFDFPDPSILHHEGVYYSFSSNNELQNICLATSEDFVNWNYHGDYDALPKLGAWADQDPEVQRNSVWAPDVVKISNDRFVMYYSAYTLEPRALCIGAAVSTTPTGPYIPEERVMFCQKDLGGGIDPSGFQDDDGTWWVTYKIRGNAIGKPAIINLQKMMPDGVTPTDDPHIELLRNDPAKDGILIEAPSIVKRKNTYYLFFSTHEADNILYDTQWATASKIEGPYTRQGKLLKAGTLHGISLDGPGSASMLQGEDRITFHNRIINPDGTWFRRLMTGELTFFPDDKVVSI